MQTAAAAAAAGSSPDPGGEGHGQALKHGGALRDHGDGGVAGAWSRGVSDKGRGKGLV